MNHVIYCLDVWLWSLIYSLYQVPSRLRLLVCAWILTKTVWLDLEDNVMKISRVCIITTMLNVSLFFFSCPREIHDKIFAHVCACLFGYPPQSGKSIGEKKNLTGCGRNEWKVCVWKQLSARLSGNDFDSLKVQKQWHYCICLLSCLFFSHVLSLYLYYLLSNAIR